MQSLVKDLILAGCWLGDSWAGKPGDVKIAVPPTALDGQGNPLDTTYTGQLFGVGDFLVALITFVIVAFVIFLIVKVSKKWGMD